LLPPCGGTAAVRHRTVHPDPRYGWRWGRAAAAGRADELLPRPLADNAVAVAAALEVLRWRGESP
jgi:hypothetical protein